MQFLRKDHSRATLIACSVGFNHWLSLPYRGFLIAARRPSRNIAMKQLKAIDNGTIALQRAFKRHSFKAERTAGASDGRELCLFCKCQLIRRPMKSEQRGLITIAKTGKYHHSRVI